MSVHVSVTGPDDEPLGEWITDEDGTHHDVSVKSSQSAIFTDIRHERFRQDDLFPGQWGRIIDEHRFAITAEEFGEVAKCVTQLYVPPPEGPATREDLRTELVQLAACVVAWLEYL